MLAGFTSPWEHIPGCRLVKACRASLHVHEPAAACQHTAAVCSLLLMVRPSLAKVLMHLQHGSEKPASTV